MVWTDTEKYKAKTVKKKVTPSDIAKLKRWKKEGWAPKVDGVPGFIGRLSFARPVKLIASVNPMDIVFSTGTGFNCQNCGLYNRHPFCSPDSPGYREAISIIQGYENAVIFVTQNDGNDPWADDPTELSHIKFETKKGFALRGAEAGTTRYLQKNMKMIEAHARKIGYRAQAFISGHCELCGRCPVKGHRDDFGIQICCPLNGLPSMETWWIDVYRWFSHGSLGKVFKENADVLQPMTFVCQDYFTLITMLLYDTKPVKKYWYPQHYKERLAYKSVKDKYAELRNGIARAVSNRKSKGIPL